jgi:predicted SPOUT superfamily RNA methylase MTH1
VRTGVLVKSEGRIFVEAGLGFPIPFNGSGKEGQKLLVQFSSAYPNFSASRAQPSKTEYWGYEVKDVGSLKDLIEQKNDTVQLITSRKGTPFNDTRHELLSRLAVIRKLLVIFGSPRNGVGEILGAERSSIRPHHIVANMFPRQATETVRLEEAILGTLAILNLSVQFQ